MLKYKEFINHGQDSNDKNVKESKLGKFANKLLKNAKSTIYGRNFMREIPEGLKSILVESEKYTFQIERCSYNDKDFKDYFFDSEKKRFYGILVYDEKTELHEI